MTSKLPRTSFSRLKSGWHFVWQKLTKPSDAITEVGLRYQARLLSVLLLVALLSTILGTLVAVLLSPPSITLTLIILTAGLAICYGLSRTQYFRVGAGLSVALLIIVPFILTAVFLDNGGENALRQLVWLLLGIILGSMYFPTKRMFYLVIVVLMGILGLTLFIFEMPVSDISGIFIFFLSTSTLILTIAYSRKLIADERQALLKTYVDKQTEINQALQQEINKREYVEEKLIASERQYESLIKAVPVGIFHTDGDGYCDYVNERWSEMGGISTTAALKEGWVQAIHPEDREMVFDLWNRAVQNNAPFKAEYRFQRPDGNTTWVYGQSVAERDANDQIIGYIGTITDINERKQLEKALRQQSNQLESLHQIGLELAVEHNLDTLLQSVVSKVSKLLNAQLNGFWLCQPEHKLLQLAATSNFDQPSVGTTINYGEGLAGRIAETGQPLIVNDYMAWNGNLNAFAETAGHAASAGVPVFLGEEIQGVLSVTAQPDYQFTQADIQMLTLFAAQASVAIQNARLHIETQLFLEKLQALHEVSIELNRIDSFGELCRQAVALGREKLGFDRLALLLYEKETNMMLGTFGTDDQGEIRDERYFRQEVDRPQIFEVLNSQSRLGFWEETEILDEHQPIGQGWNAMSVLWDGHEGIGWLSADNFIKKEPPTTHMLEIFTLYGATLGHLVTRHRVEEALQQEKEEARHFQEKLRILHDVTIDLSNTNTLDEFYYQAIEAGRNKLGFDRLGLLLYDDEAHTMVGTFGTDDHGEIRDERDYKGKVHPPEILDILEGKKRLGFWQDASLRDMGEAIGQGWSAMAVLWDGHEGLGWLATDNLIKREPPLNYMLEILTLYGSTLGHLVTRKRAEAMLQQRAQHLSLLHDITHTTLQALDFSTMLQILADRLTELIDADNCFITLWNNELKRVIPVAGYELGHDAKPRVNIVPGETTLTESVLQAGRPLVAEDVHHSPYLSPQLAAQFDISSALALPLIAGRQKLGAALISFNEPHSFTEDEIRRGEQAASQISLALAQAQLQEQLREHAVDLEKKNQELRDFNHVVSHDLKAPLRTIIAFGDRVLQKYADVLDPKGYDYLERSVNAANRMQTLIQNLLTLSRVTTEDQQYTDVDLNRVIQDVVSDLEVLIVDSGATINVGTLPTISADEIQMRQLFQNLIGNALKFHREGIPPVVDIYVEPEREGWCKIFVKDNGIGFEDKFAEQIFEMFQRLHSRSAYAGTGAGLAICRRIVVRHSGEITAVSELDQGATFIVELPLRSDER